MNFETAKKIEDNTENIAAASRHIAAPANASAAWSDLLAFWTDRRWTERAWPVPNTNDTAGVADHALKTYRSLLKVQQATTEAFCETARRQQEVTFGFARTALDAYPKLAADRGEGPEASWKRVMAGYAEAYNEGLGVSQAMAEAAFRLLARAPGPVLVAKGEERSAR